MFLNTYFNYSIAQEWETVDSVWSENFKFLINEDNQHIIAKLNLSEAWINAAHQTYNTSLEALKNGAGDTTAIHQAVEVLIPEVKVIDFFKYYFI